MTPLKPEEIQAASEWFNSHYCQSECAHYNTICRALAFTLAANGEPSDRVVETGGQTLPPTNRLTDCFGYARDCYKAMIAKIWEEC